MVDRHKPYNALPPLPPVAELETVPVLRALTRASRALAELKGLSEAMPNAKLLVDALMLQETQASSSIENVVTTQDELYKAQVLPDHAIAPQVKETLRYRAALNAGLGALEQRPLNVNVFQRIQGVLEQVEGRVRQVPGTTLKAGTNVIYTPPVGEHLIRDLLDNLVAYLYSDTGPDPLVRMAVAHYQFEAIHPFTDGNGRTGRIINVLYLVEQGLLPAPILYLSGYLLHNRAIYYQLLDAVTQHQAFEEWVLFLLEGIAQAARATVTKIHRLLDQMKLFAEDVRRVVPEVYSQELVSLLFRYPYCKYKLVEETLGVSRLTARKYLLLLENGELLTSEKVGTARYFLNQGLLRLLSEPYSFESYGGKAA